MNEEKEKYYKSIRRSIKKNFKLIDQIGSEINQTYWGEKSIALDDFRHVDDFRKNGLSYSEMKKAGYQNIVLKQLIRYLDLYLKYPSNLKLSKSYSSIILSNGNENHTHLGEHFFQIIDRTNNGNLINFELYFNSDEFKGSKKLVDKYNKLYDSINKKHFNSEVNRFMRKMR